MGGSASKKVEAKLLDSPLFQAAVETSFQDCLVLSHHTSAGSIFLYQLLDASRRVYDILPQQKIPGLLDPNDDEQEDAEDPAPSLKWRWLSSPPSQADVDRTLLRERFAGKKTLTREEFHFFAVCLFRDMVISSAEHRLAFYVPVGTLVVLCAHLTAGRLPFVGPLYRSAGFLTPGLLLGSVVGALAALGYRFP